jgi:acetyl-CoA synthase
MTTKTFEDNYSTAFPEPAFRGTHIIVEKAKNKWQEAMDRWGANEPVGFPNTAYYLPIIYGITGIKVEKLGDMEAVLKKCKAMLPSTVIEEHYLSYLNSTLKAGMIAVWAEEIMEAIKYLESPSFYTRDKNAAADNILLGAADDIIMKKMGIDLVAGTAPGLAAIVGGAMTPEIAKHIAEELQRKNVYVFMSGESRGARFSERLVKAGVSTDWDTRLEPCGPDVSALVFTFGFTTRVAIDFGGIEAGDYRKILNFCRERLPGIIINLGDVTGELLANCAGAMNWGFTVNADRPIPGIPSGSVSAGKHLVPNVTYDKIVSQAIESRGIKMPVTIRPIPVAFGPEFEGERVRGDDIFLEAGAGTQMVEWVTSKRMEEVEDGKLEIFGPDLDQVKAGSQLPLAIKIDVASRRMQGDYESVPEHHIHRFINYAQGVMHTGRRDAAFLRVSKKAVEKGFRLRHIADILYNGLHRDFGRIIDKLQIKIYTESSNVASVMVNARTDYKIRDARIEGMTDESVDTYYSCTICQSLAPGHVCIISPERSGLCGSYNWMDCKAAYEINPTGPNQPVAKGDIIDARLGQWKGVNKFVAQASGSKIDRCSLYSIMQDPITTCDRCEAISAILPLCNGIMTVYRSYNGETPCGMGFTTLADTLSGGLSTPGFIGHGKYDTIQRKFISAEGGLLRIVWMPKIIKEEIGNRFKKRASELGVPDLLDCVADETIGVTEQAILPFLREKDHPALKMEPILGA